MRAVVINCTLKATPQVSATEALADVVADCLRERDVEVSAFRAADLSLPPGTATDMGGSDAWPGVHDLLTGARVLVVASPARLGRASSLAWRVLERMSAMRAETGEDGRPVAYDKVAGVVATGQEDGVRHVVSGIGGALADIGYTIPGHAWVHAPGDPRAASRDRPRAHRAAATMAANLVTTARALEADPLERPSS
ncbi:NAD(P)H-dependent oxidoreductase [Streptomyces sp. PTM05]|uniref:NAD(P)H-dependent oxidoreductase n=1 Tax=Streptantibioticus parmotrematis TaxID=2873249 RepID=A0ABS7QRH7_9ACTN|nr:NAD(P)H-dependent oxidoreductase [Streptantibioticus parmotrematis]MBY8885543.1 NAD(P)H-dependent oxidoreductase [Streptantibioticus parmotrematis]